MFKHQRIHVIGIGGIGASGLARMLRAEGAQVSGSDMQPSAIVTSLRAQGIAVSIGHNPGNLPAVCDTVVYSAAVKPNNPELVEANRRGIEVMKYARMLGRLMSARRGIAVAGTHGKTTTTAMIAYILQSAGFDPSYIVGGVVSALEGSSGVGRGGLFVAEACEYDRNFLELWPETAVVLNIEEDHLDYYRDLQEIVDTFRAFTQHVPPHGRVIVNGQDPNALKPCAGLECAVQTVGFRNDHDWQALNRQIDSGRYAFDVAHRGRAMGRVRLAIPGAHNVMNALAAIAVCMEHGVAWDACVEALASFRGVERRFQIVADTGGITVVDDYAHHPTEIQATLNGAREFFSGRRIWCVFQPHQHSRTRFLMNDFARCFGSAGEVLVPDIYFVRDSEADRQAVSSRDLVDRITLHGGRAHYLPTFDEIMVHLQEHLRPGDVVITMGAGDINAIAYRLADKLRDGSLALQPAPAPQQVVHEAATVLRDGRQPRIAVAMGGPSSEREVSLNSGRAVAAALKAMGQDVTEIDLADAGIAPLATGGFDAVFVALHGAFGEDGTLQTLLEDAGLAYTFSRPAASSLAMDKYVSKTTFIEKGISTPPFAMPRGRQPRRELRAFIGQHGWPLVVKPVSQGSSIGVSICRNEAELTAAVKEVANLSDRVLVERYIAGREFTVGVLENKALPVIELVTPHTFYDYSAKYIDHSTSYLFEFDLPEGIYAEIQSLALAAHRALGCRDLSRVDLRMDGGGRLFVLEVNTIPGFTSTSLVPKAAARAGIPFGELCLRLVNMALGRAKAASDAARASVQGDARCSDS